MYRLRDIFSLHGARDSASLGAVSDSQSDAGAKGGVLTLEFRDNPFASFMRRLERLIDQDPVAALKMARLALLDKVFGKAVEDRLRHKMDAIIERLAQAQPAGTPMLLGAFTRAGFSLAPASAASLSAPQPAAAMAPGLAL